MTTTWLCSGSRPDIVHASSQDAKLNDNLDYSRTFAVVPIPCYLPNSQIILLLSKRNMCIVLCYHCGSSSIVNF